MTSDHILKALGELAAIQAKTARASPAIRVRALGARTEIDRRLAELAPRLVGNADAQAEHQTLVLERGRLDRVLAAR